jgi:hypothetical protein
LLLQVLCTSSNTGDVTVRVESNKQVETESNMKWLSVSFMSALQTAELTGLMFDTLQIQHGRDYSGRNWGHDYISTRRHSEYQVLRRPRDYQAALCRGSQ